MPKSKRSKLVSLTKTKTDRKALKMETVEKVRSLVDEFERVFVLSIDGLRSTPLKTLRREWRDSRFLLGKNRVMAIAFGSTEAEEYRPSLHLVSQQLEGEVCLLFTNRSEEEVVKFFDAFSERDYARAGAVVDETVTITPEDFEGYDLSHTLHDQLRKLSMPVFLDKGVLRLPRPHVVCSAGDVLSPEQASLLKVFWKPLATFHVGVRCVWNDAGTFKLLGEAAR